MRAVTPSHSAAGRRLTPAGCRRARKGQGMGPAVSFSPPGRWSHPARLCLVTPPSPAHRPSSAGIVPPTHGSLGPLALLKCDLLVLCVLLTEHTRWFRSRAAHGAASRGRKLQEKHNFQAAKKTSKGFPTSLAPLVCIAPRDGAAAHLHTQTRALPAIYGRQRAGVGGVAGWPRPLGDAAEPSRHARRSFAYQTTPPIHSPRVG